MVKFYQVGGYVRDKIIGRASNDIDYSVEAPSFEVMVDEIKRRGEVFQVKPKFFTVRANVPELGGACDFVMCRREESYTDGRHPDKVEPGSIYDDLARRDFTINAIALEPETGKLLDPFNGQFDIKRRLIRSVGDTSQKFQEDGLRVIRAIRFAVTLNFSFSADIRRDLTQYHTAELLNNVSRERIREELFKAFSANTPRTLSYLNHFPEVCRVLFQSGDIWLLPTMKERK